MVSINLADFSYNMLNFNFIHITKPATNIVLAIGGLNGFVSAEVQNSTFVLRINFGAKNPRLRQYPKRYEQFEVD
ncbi:hypothetical protein MASR2M12_14400 [Bacteroidales bacterium]